MRQDSARPALVAIGGTLLASVIAVAAAVGFVKWRASEQQLALETDISECKRGSAPACDKLRRGCAKKSGGACRALAEAYLDGRGVPKNVAEGTRYLEQACTYRQGSACTRLARLLQSDDRSARDSARIRDLFERGCLLDDAEACAARSVRP